MQQEEERHSWVNKIFMTNPYMEVKPTWKSSISMLAITVVEFFLPK